MSEYSKGLQYIFQPGEMTIRPQFPRPGFKIAFEYLTTLAQYYEIMKDLDTVQMVSFDTETTSLHFDELVQVSFSFAYNNKVWVVLVNHVQEDHCFTDYGLLKALVWKILTRPIPFLFNARFDIRVARKTFGIEQLMLSPVDVQSLIFIADSNQKMPKLKPSAKSFLGIDAPELPPEWLGVAMQSAPLPAFGEYGAYDAYNTLKLGEMFYYEVYQRYPLIAKLDRKLIPALMYFEDSEFNVDRAQIVTLQTEATERMLTLQESIYDAVGVFLLTSNVQLVKKLVSLGYDTRVKTKTGQMSVAITALDSLKHIDFVKNIIEYKKLSKLNSSYIQPMLNRVDLGVPFRFHYVLNNAPTLRLSASSYNKDKKKADQQRHYFTGMNFQSLTKPTMISRRVDWNSSTFNIDFNDNGRFLVEAGRPYLNLRNVFIVPNDEWLYAPIDYAGQELRIIANLSGEPVWVNAFLSGRDIHKETAIKIWGAHNYDKNKRKKAKIANFLIIYGGNEFTLASKLGMSIQEATEFYVAYKAALPVLFSWIDQIHTLARRQGYVITPYGVPRRLSFYYRQGGKVAGYADRSAVNTMVQGSAAVIIRIALTRLFSHIGPKVLDTIKSDFYGDVLFRGTVHDEIDPLVKKVRFREFLSTVIPLMINTTPSGWPVPMDVEVSVGRRWGEVFAIDYKDPNLAPIEVEEEEVKPPPEGYAEDDSYDMFEDELNVFEDEESFAPSWE